MTTPSEGVEWEGVVEIAAVAGNLGTLRCGDAWCDAFAKSGGNMFIGGSEGQNEVSERQLDGVRRISRGICKDFGRISEGLRRIFRNGF